MTLLRLGIYCLLSFVPFWIILPRMNAFYGGPVYMSEAAEGAVYVLGIFGMLIPAAAHVCTRLVTKEGFRDSYLALHFKGNELWYLASFGIKLLEGFLGLFLVWRLYASHLSFAEAFLVDQSKNVIAMLLAQLAFSIGVCFPAFGEEWGWRGYMMPKLMELMSKPAAIFCGGLIWGLWHAPLTIAGHNFGVDYPMYPWAGIFKMCLMCILMNAVLTLLTEKTKSIYPATFYHMVNNNMSMSVLVMLVGTEALERALESASTFYVIYVPLLSITAVLSVLCFVRSPHKETSEKNT